MQRRSKTMATSAQDFEELEAVMGKVGDGIHSIPECWLHSLSPWQGRGRAARVDGECGERKA